MSINIETIAYKNRWFRWVPRAAFFAACASRVFYLAFYLLAIKLVGPKYWAWDDWGFIFPVLVVTALAWFAPIAGGIIAIVWIPLAWFFIAAEVFGDPARMGSVNIWPLPIESIFLLVGGITSILWGVWRRKK